MPLPPPIRTASPIAMIKRATSYAAALVAVLLVNGCQPVAADDASGAISPGDLDLVQRTMKEVEKSYVEPVTSNDLTTNALKGMLTRLDPHSDYMDEREFHDLMATTSGQFGGVGIEISVDDGVPQVISAIEGTPAAVAGLNPGDRIIKADGQALVGMDIEEVVRKLRGAPGTPVTLTIARSGHPAFDVKVVRAIIKVDSVKAQLEPGRVGYARVSTFDENTAAELRAAIGKMKQEAGGNYSGFILDLRNDAGGLLDAAVEVAADFLDTGTVVSTRGRDPDENRVYEAPPNGDLVRGVPLVVLINGASASASEIVAGALQDDHRGAILGTRSFGKGSVQSIIPIEDHGALRLTTALYYTPSGRSIQGHGITPDQVVPLPKDEQVAGALVTYESDLYGSLKATGALAPAKPNGPSAPAPLGPQSSDHPINPQVLGTPQDAQLQSALEYLKKHPRSASAR
jgi:carboxyl-terminal processing protease